jgi:lysozyme family protein
MDFDPFVNKILAAEGGYVNLSGDRGGETNFGITVAVARANGYTGDMINLPQSLARMIYLKRYITEPKFDRIANVNESVAAELIDTGVNMGPATAAMFFQRWINGFNYKGPYQDVFVDGRIGQITISAFAAFLAWRKKDGEVAMLRALNSLQGARYLDLAERDVSQRQFTFGWMVNRVAI